MRIRTGFPSRIRVEEHVRIPMEDGVTLSARLWIPEDAEAFPVPALLEAVPYRKRDGTRWRDEPMHGWFAGHGYASLRLDLRGSGESEGHLTDEYTERELRDTEEVLGWLRRQPWCTGRLGLIGKSWGGIHALQVASRRPHGLGAVISVCSTDDRYSDDAHYMGGCLLNENLIWGSVLMAVLAQPPDPAIVGDHWRALWEERLDHLEFFPARWMAHPRRDAYWKRGSVGEDLSRIEAPVFAVGGWADAYTNSIPRLLAGLSGPRRGLVGPWAHVYPHNGVPGPAIGFLQEARRWWDHWLKDRDTGVMREPQYRVWMQESVAPAEASRRRPGRWVAESRWPSSRIHPRTWMLDSGDLVADQAGRKTASAKGGMLTVCSPQSVGFAGGAWCGFGIEGEAAADQRTDDAGSLVFDSPPLGERMEILGAPEIELRLGSDRPRAQLAVRLSDIRPDGSVALVTYGLLNLAHRDGHENPRELTPGESIRVTMALNHVAHAFPAGHRLRVSLSTAYWPMVWPSPEPVTLQVESGSGQLRLPVRPPDPADSRLGAFEEPETAPGPRIIPVSPGGSRSSIHHDARTGEVVSTAYTDGDEFGEAGISRIEDIDLETGHAVHERFTIHPQDPLSARGEVEHQVLLRRGEWKVRIEARVECISTLDHFLLEGEIRALEGETPLRIRRWAQTIPRDLL